MVCQALAAAGAQRIAFEDPSNPEDSLIAARAGLEPVLIRVDQAGTRVDELERADADAVVLTPAHQHPTGVVLSGERRTALLAWLRASDAIAIEDDYDAAMNDYRPASRGHPRALLLGYAQMPEPSIRAGVHELAKAVHAARSRA